MKWVLEIDYEIGMNTNIRYIEFMFISMMSVIVVVGIQSYEYRYD